MKLRIKTDAASDRLLNQIAHDLSMTPEAVAEVAVYNLIASYLIDKHGQDAADDFLLQTFPDGGDMPLGVDGDDCTDALGQLGLAR